MVTVVINDYTRDFLEKKLLGNLNTTKEQMANWRNDPYYLDGVLASKFWMYIKNAPHVAIVGDYDCDGISATYVLTKAIKEVCPGKGKYIRLPRRFSEGYGINETIANEIREKCPKGTVVITVDNGIAAAPVLESLERDGYPVLVTDHHSLRPDCDVPKVTMVIDPAVPETSEGFRFKGWCGAAVAYKLCEQFVSSDLAKDLETIAGLATVADCMELKEGNWGLVRRSIENFRAGIAPKVLSELLIALGQDPNFVNEEHFGFYLGPCFNAPGRITDNGASAVLSYLINPNEEKLNHLVDLNNKRKIYREEEYVIVREYILNNNLQNQCPIWVAIPNLHEGIAGILAGKVTEEFNKPAIVVTNSQREEGMYTGSARSIGDFNIFDYLSSFPEVFNRFGGHAGAAGLSLPIENFEKASSHQVDWTYVENKDMASMYIDASDITDISSLLKEFRPFGQGNPAPTFDLEFDFEQNNGKMIGKQNNKIHLCAEADDRSYKITHWFHEPNNLFNKRTFGMRGKVTDTSYAGVETPTFNVEEVYDISDEKSKGKGKG